LIHDIIRSLSDLQRLGGGSNVVTNHFPTIIHAGSDLKSLVIEEQARNQRGVFLVGLWIE
jgi:hypothetical protein